MEPNAAITHSGRLGPRIDTVPPAGTPRATSARPARRASDAKAFQLHSRHEPPTLRRSAVRSPNRRAVSKKVSMVVPGIPVPSGCGTTLAEGGDGVQFFSFQ